ncbi:MAG TPA: ECF transporter S component [Roseiflexaceae bacterium]|nr:ECF transporter S component [Roseiflexaceae bacterium]
MIAHHRLKSLALRHSGAATLALICALGAAAFLYPFFLAAPAPGGETAAHQATAPLIFAVLGPALLALLLADLGAGRLNARTVAVLGVLTALNAALRLPAGPGDAPTFFFLVILAGYVYGGRFGFLLGALSLFVSALLTGGVGPWMPFQMFAMGWMGLSSGGLGRLARALALPPGRWGELALLALWGYLWGFLFGALMNLWSWPFVAGDALHWQPGLGLGETLRRYAAFYALTSLAWDSLRALGNLVLILALGRTALKELRRFQARFQWTS